MAAIRYALLAALSLLVLIAASAPLARASYTVKNLNVTLILNQNTSAQVTEVLQIEISNESVSQYTTNRAALNLTLSNWQSLIGPELIQHIINPNSSVYNFKFFPGPVSKRYGQSYANMTLIYYVKNVTFVNETAPRMFQYRFNPKVFNFQHGVSGEVLSSNTTLTMIIPQAGVITTVYPIPDLPPDVFATNYKNVTRISWVFGEPLSKFTLIYVVKQSIPAEVEGFFSAIYKALGIFTYVIIIVVVLLLILYVYNRASR